MAYVSSSLAQLKQAILDSRTTSNALLTILGETSERYDWKIRRNKCPPSLQPHGIDSFDSIAADIQGDGVSPGTQTKGQANAKANHLRELQLTTES